MTSKLSEVTQITSGFTNSATQVKSISYL